MERRKAITTAAAASLTLLAGAAGMTLSSNIVGVGANDDVGQLSPVSSLVNPPVTIYVDEPSDRVGSLATVPPLRTAEATPITTSSASGYADDEYGHDDHGDGDDRYEDHEYEGGDDDD